ncbi:hypothetical protein [Chiayiivirga flava]|uniref:Uncharacterized protein n=1 Tax=Chiayiivirga flava TaxID=659595 RepID=A0A7W8D5N3_9GAMM|nr:hypothetical protein [Chiayiivirga flava]MBB5206703.1 hypothetical protein [Chiayiivirga flava]
MKHFQDFVIYVLVSGALSTVLASIVLWLGRAWISERLKHAIKAEYDEKLESHKAQLKAQSDVELEKLRSELSVRATEHQVTFSRLHEKRAEVIAQTYSNLRAAHDAIKDYTKVFEPAGGLSREGRRKIAADAQNAYYAYYSKHQIFLPKTAAQLLDDLNRSTIQIFNHFLFLVDRKPDGGIDEWIKISERVDGPYQAALGELESAFRKILGSEI